MFFVGTILTAVGYTLLYAGVKGDSYTVGGVPVWRRPWLPFIDIFSGHALSQGAGPKSDSSVNPGDQLASAVSAASSAQLASSSAPQQAPAPAPSSSGRPSSPVTQATGGAWM